MRAWPRDDLANHRASKLESHATCPNSLDLALSEHLPNDHDRMERCRAKMRATAKAADPENRAFVLHPNIDWTATSRKCVVETGDRSSSCKISSIMVRSELQSEIENNRNSTGLGRLTMCLFFVAFVATQFYESQ